MKMGKLFFVIEIKNSCIVFTSTDTREVRKYVSGVEKNFKIIALEGELIELKSEEDETIEAIENEVKAANVLFTQFMDEEVPDRFKIKLHAFKSVYNKAIFKILLTLRKDK